MNRRLKYIAIVLGIVLIVIVTNIMMKESYVKSLELHIIYPTKDRILSEKEITDTLQTHFGRFTSQKRKQIEPNKIREYLKQKNFIEDASVSISITGVLKIFITQSTAIVRVYGKHGSYYIDRNMKIIEPEEGKVADVLIASGQITDKPVGQIDTVKDSQSYAIYKLSSLLYKDSILKYQIDQIVCQKDGYMLVPKVGTYEIILGNEKDRQDELTRLHWLYKKAFVKNGWENYSKIDLRFRNQVICTRK